MGYKDKDREFVHKFCAFLRYVKVWDGSCLMTPGYDENFADIGTHMITREELVDLMTRFLGGKPIVIEDGEIPEDLMPESPEVTKRTVNFVAVHHCDYITKSGKEIHRRAHLRKIVKNAFLGVEEQ